MCHVLFWVERLFVSNNLCFTYIPPAVLCILWGQRSSHHDRMIQPLPPTLPRCPLDSLDVWDPSFGWAAKVSFATGEAQLSSFPVRPPQTQVSNPVGLRVAQSSPVGLRSPPSTLVGLGTRTVQLPGGPEDADGAAACCTSSAEADGAAAIFFVVCCCAAANLLRHLQQALRRLHDLQFIGHTSSYAKDLGLDDCSCWSTVATRVCLLVGHRCCQYVGTYLARCNGFYLTLSRWLWGHMA
ncbi:uncharacterized protein LOC133560811 [Nerophis ophidion]|uniref:uncharacterized protein LOC133560811 n=1 Tax=Nerophis ophidion TaxID=159077 RepID=UPI002ADF4649|nr:uncharacterized protein LOC133560811 [Nerophis ophidion]